jgi:hypothetical protein
VARYCAWVAVYWQAAKYRKLRKRGSVSCKDVDHLNVHEFGNVALLMYDVYSNSSLAAAEHVRDLLLDYKRTASYQLILVGEYNPLELKVCALRAEGQAVAREWSYGFRIVPRYAYENSSDHFCLELARAYLKETHLCDQGLLTTPEELAAKWWLERTVQSIHRICATIPS